MYKSVRALAYCSILSLGACASIVKGSTDHINVATAPAENVSCSFTNSRGTVDSYAPGVVSIKKSRSDLDIYCIDANGGKGQGKLVSEVEPWDFGNILIGGLIGMGVDWGTGAAYNYPDSTTIVMTPAAPSPAAYYSTPTAPAAQPVAASTAMTPTASAIAATPSYAPPTAQAAPFGGPTPSPAATSH